MSESNEEKVARLHSMLTDNGGTWDLSRNDKAAIRYALERLAKATAFDAKGKHGVAKRAGDAGHWSITEQIAPGCVMYSNEKYPTADAAFEALAKVSK